MMASVDGIAQGARTAAVAMTNKKNRPELFSIIS
jgi:hypothetical protein